MNELMCNIFKRAFTFLILVFKVNTFGWYGSYDDGSMCFADVKTAKYENLMLKNYFFA